MVPESKKEIPLFPQNTGVTEIMHFKTWTLEFNCQNFLLIGHYLLFHLVLPAASQIPKH